jgi:integrase
MAADDEERIDVRGDGRIMLFKRMHLKNPNWQTRISVPNAKGYKQVTTGTTDLREAERFAVNLYEELYMQVKAGGALQTKTFKQVFEEWKLHANTLGHTRSDGSWDATVGRIALYALSFFGAKRIDTITGTDFTDYWAWRKTNCNRKAPSLTTLRRERTSILPVFKYALSKGYIIKLPDSEAPKAKSERRPTFSTVEWKTIRDASPAWVDRARVLGTWRDRFMAMHCFLTLAYTGLRIGELRQLRWGDISSVSGKLDEGTTGKYIVGQARGKTGPRQFVAQPGLEASFYLLYTQRCAELAAANPEADEPRPDPADLIFCHPDGRPIKEYKHSFMSLLKFAGVPIEKDGMARSIYSLRHFYATSRLSKEASPFLVAQNMGTSVEMLEKHYGQVVTSKLAAQITKSGPSDIVFKGGIKLPF